MPERRRRGPSEGLSKLYPTSSSLLHGPYPPPNSRATDTVQELVMLPKTLVAEHS